MNIGATLLGAHALETGTPEAALAWVTQSQAEEVAHEEVWRAVVARGDLTITRPLMARWPDQVPAAFLSWVIERQADVAPVFQALQEQAHPALFALVDQAFTDGVAHPQWPGLGPLLRLVPEHAWSNVGFIKAMKKLGHFITGAPDPLDALLTHTQVPELPDTLAQQVFEAGGGAGKGQRLDLLDVFWARRPTQRPRAIFALLSAEHSPEDIRRRLGGDKELIEATHALLNERLKNYTNLDRDWASLDTLGCLVEPERQARWLAEHPGRLPRTALHHEAIQRQHQAHEGAPEAVRRPRLRS